MLAGLAAAVLIGDLFLAVRGAAMTSVEFIYGIAGFALAHVFRTVGQLREARPDWRVALAAAIPLVALRNLGIFGMALAIGGHFMI